MPSWWACNVFSCHAHNWGRPQQAPIKRVVGPVHMMAMLLLLLLLLFIGKPQQAFKASLQGARDIS